LRIAAGFRKLCATSREEGSYLVFRLLGPAASLLAIVAVACSGGVASTPAPTAAPPTSAPATAAPTSAAVGPTVSVATDGYFVGPNGMTLYTFDKDTAGTSNCQADPCLTNWPALTVASAGEITVGTGLTAADFGTVARSDGASQVAFKEIPLYYFAGDQAAGDTNGDGVGGIWHLAKTTSTLPAASAPASAPASATASAPASAPASTSGGGPSGPCYDAHYQEVPCPSSGSGSSAAAGAPTIAIADAGYLVGPNGLTLYTFDNDTAADASSCTDDCLANWPALTVDSADDMELGEGVDDDDVTTFTRADDGTIQVSYYGKPLYYYAGDTAPGQTNGDGLFDVWHQAMPQ
jgi:predicted lipoprotein with Yx(FWY)xxD motif